MVVKVCVSKRHDHLLLNLFFVVDEVVVAEPTIGAPFDQFYVGSAANTKGMHSRCQGSVLANKIDDLLSVVNCAISQ